MDLTVSVFGLRPSSARPVTVQRFERDMLWSAITDVDETSDGYREGSLAEGVYKARPKLWAGHVGNCCNQLGNVTLLVTPPPPPPLFNVGDANTGPKRDAGGYPRCKGRWVRRRGHARRAREYPQAACGRAAGVP